MEHREIKPVYPYSQTEAKRSDALDEWRESHKENVECKEFIEQTIRDYFDGMHLNLGCAKKIVDEFGYHRTAFVLANTLKHKSYDDRFSDSNKQWSRGYFIPNESNHLNADFAVDSHPAVLDGVVTQYKVLQLSLGMVIKDQCVADTSEQNFEGKVIAIKPIHLSENHLTIQDQLWLATSGFGCRPGARGQAVFATCLSDGEKARWDRHQVLGVVEDEHIPEWAVEKLSELRQEEAPTTQMGGMEMQ